MDNVAVFVEDDSRAGNLLGLYHGVPLTSRNNAYGYSSGTLPMPDRITIYRVPICRISRTEDEVVRAGPRDGHPRGRPPLRHRRRSVDRAGLGLISARRGRALYALAAWAIRPSC